MSKRIHVAVALSLLSALAVGCSSGGLRQKLDQFARDQEDLRREKAEVESELLACRARCESLERRSRPAPAAAPFEVPSELKGKVDIRRRGNDTVIDIPSDVFFASGSATLTATSERTMSDVADFIRRSHPSGMIRVEGHSDNDPIRRTKSKYHCNWELSFERAHAVVHYLVEKGKFDPQRVVCESFGEYHPLDPKNKSRNRRVEIVIAH